MLILFLTCANAAAFESSLRPSIIYQDNKYTAALDFDLEWDRTLFCQTSPTYRKSVLVDSKIDGRLTGNSGLNTKPLRIEMAVRGFLNMSGPEISEFGAQEGEVIVSQPAFNYGRVNGGFNLGYETDQALDHRNMTIGSEIGYVMIQNEGSKAIIPSLISGYEWVFVDRSAANDRLGVDDNSRQRFHIFASWKIPVGDYLPELFKPLNLHIDARYYQDYGCPEVSRQESKYVAATIDYVFRQPVRSIITGAFIRYEDGRISPAVTKSTTFSAGFTVK